MRLLVALSLFLALVVGDTTATIYANGLSFDTSRNLTVSDDRFKYRQTDFVKIPFIPFALYTSISVDGQGDQQSGTVDADALIGFVSMPLSIFPLIPKNPPSALMGYITAHGTYTSLSTGFSGNLDGSAALVGSVYKKIEELNPSGFVVKTWNFKDFTWTDNGVSKSGPNNELKYITYTSTSNGFTTTLTFAVSSVLGKLNVGGATVTPRNMEAFFEVQNYPYVSPANRLRLTVYMGHAASQVSATFSSTQTITAGSGNSQIYVKLATDAVADGKSVAVTVSGMDTILTDLSELDNSAFTAQLTSVTGIQSEVRRFEVTFPPGAVDISYDPAIGMLSFNLILFYASISLFLPFLMNYFLFYKNRLWSPQFSWFLGPKHCIYCCYCLCILIFDLNSNLILFFFSFSFSYIVSFF